MTLLKKLINSIFCSDLQAPAANKVRLTEVLKVWSEELRSGKSIIRNSGGKAEQSMLTNYPGHLVASDI